MTAIPDDLRELLREHRLGLAKCLRCKQCTFTDDYRAICPSYRRFGYNAYSGGGKVQLARALLDGAVDLDRDLADVFYACTTCGACTEQCFNYGVNTEEFNPVEVTERVREALVDAGVGPLAGQAENLQRLRDTRNPYGKPHAARLDWLAGRRVPERADTVFFVGCTGPYVEQELARSTVAILEALGEDYAVMGDEWCCGSYALRLGDRELAVELAQHNVEALRASGAKRIVTQCPGCFKTLNKDYARLGFPLNVPVLHITQHLAKLLEDDKVKFRQVGEGRRVTYHDPCHIGRHCGVYEEPRRVIEAMGFELVEMPRNRDDAWCCGAGGGVKSGYPEWALETAKERIREAEGTGANVLVTTCPFCQLNLVQAAEAIGSKVQVTDLNALVLQALGGTRAASKQKR